MSLAELVPLVLRISIFGIVLALGLRVGRGEATWVLRHPRPLLVGGLAMFVVMPLVAVLLVSLFDLRAPVGIALVALSLSPVPPVLPRKELKAGGEASRVVGLFVAAGVLAIVLVPLGVHLIGGWLGADVAVSPTHIAVIVGLTVLVPLAAGLLVRRLWPGAAERLAAPVAKAAVVLLLLGLVPVVVMAAPVMAELVGGGTLAAFAAFLLAGLAVGHVLGGRREADRTVLALSTATRHPGIALAIAAAVAPEPSLVGPAILLYLVVGAVLSGIYLAVRRRRTPATPAPQG